MKASLFLVTVLVAACEEPPSAKTPTNEPVHEEMRAPRPAPPPLTVQASEAFYIVSIPKAVVTAASVTVCHSNADCNALLPPDPPNIVRRFDQEAWIVIEVPVGQDAKNVISDGTVATARVEPSQSTESKVVLYRVAPGVKEAKLSTP